MRLISCSLGAGNPDNMDNISPVTETFNLVPRILEDISYDGTDQFPPGSGGQGMYLHHLHSDRKVVDT